MKIGLVGSNGFLGQAILSKLDSANEVVRFQRGGKLSTLDGCEVLINANGNSSKVLAENDPQGDFEANTKLTLELSLIAARNGALLVHFSSGEASLEIDAKNQSMDVTKAFLQLSNYGLSKAIGEILVQRYAKKWIIVRPSGLIGPGMKKGPIFDVINGDPVWIDPESQLRILTTRTTAKITLELIERHQSGNEPNGIYNLTSFDSISLREIAQLLKKTIIEKPNLPISNPRIYPSENLDQIKLPSAREEVLEFWNENSDENN